MGIFDIDNKELDIISRRVAFNHELKGGVGEAYKLACELQSSDYDRSHGKIYINNSGNLVLNNSYIIQDNIPDLLTKYHHDDIIKDLYINNIRFVLDEVSDNALPPRIISKNITFAEVKEVRNMHLTLCETSKVITNASSITPGILRLEDCTDIKFHNTTVDFIGSRKTIISSDSKPVDFTGLKSNVMRYICFIERGFRVPNEFNSLFKPTTCHLYDTKKGVETSISVKSLTDAQKIVSNKKWRVHDHILQVNPNINFVDVVGIRDMKDLNTYEITDINRHIILRFVKEGTSACYQATYSITPDQEPDDAPMDVLYPKTRDGWYVQWLNLK